MNDTQHDCTEELHRASLKVTPARLGVLHALEHAHKPLDVSMIIDYLKENEIPADDVTVFRILHAFVEKKLAKPIQFNEGKQRYEYADKPSHHHFICRSCGTIIDVTECTVSHMEKMLEHSEGVTVEHHSLEFFGLCKTCQS